MPAPISVVIPTLNAAQELPTTLAALTPALTEGLIRELIVSDGGSTDGTCDLAEDLGAVIVSGAPGRGGQLRRGVDVSKGEWLLILHADTHLQGPWIEGLLTHMADAPERAGHFQLRFRARGAWPAWVAGWANLRSRLLGLPYGDQGLFLKRSLHDSVGGYPDIPLMEDVALARSLKGKLSPVPGQAATSAARYEKQGWLNRGSRNLWLLTRYLSGADPHRLAQSYAPKPRPASPSRPQ